MTSCDPLAVLRAHIEAERCPITREGSLSEGWNMALDSVLKLLDKADPRCTNCDHLKEIHGGLEAHNGVCFFSFLLDEEQFVCPCFEFGEAPEEPTTK